jgi:single-stranded-DNA-specific exonuclease
MKSRHPLPAKRWVHLPLVEESERLALEASVRPMLGHVLWHRGCQTLERVQDFLAPKLQSLSDPFLLTDLQKAAAVILKAIEESKQIVIYGDYDVDGMTSTAFFYRFLKKLGARVDCFLPSRMSEGYGLTLQGVKRCLEEKRPELLICVDCATTAIAETDFLREQGIDVVIVDHHELAGERPHVTAFVNPHQDGILTYLASVGLVFKVCHGILKLGESQRQRVDLREFLDLVALGTVADLVPLIEENRILVQRGLEQITKSQILGIRSLKRVSGIRGEVKASDVGFRLAPRLNAGGRLGDACRSLDVLISDDEAEVERLVQVLDQANKDRQKIEQTILQEAFSELSECFSPESDRVIVLGRRGWHCGVIGIVASRIQKAYHRPTLIVGFDESGTGKGSGRSVEGCSLVDLLRSCDEHLVTCGGHEMAAGLTVNESSFDQFKKAIHLKSVSLVDLSSLQPTLTLHGKLPARQVGEKLYEELNRLAPFGQKNSQPIFEIDGLEMSRSPKTFGNNHVKFFFKGDGREVEAVGFDMADRPWSSNGMRFAGILDWDDYRDQVNVRVVDWKTD